MKYLGCAYYPEYWGAERVAEDARLMAEAGINLARIGEFAWSRMEPADGQFTLDWLHAAIEVLAKRGIGVLMCTPTAAPPAWLSAAHPEICLVRADGQRARHGRRRHYCPVSPTYRQYSVRVVATLARELARHPNIVAWQLDNEFGPENGWCYCPDCQAAFLAWLRARYGSLAALNAAWGTGFWSMDYTDWGEVRLPGEPDVAASRVLDAHRFWSASMIDYAQAQADVLRASLPGVCVTTNGMGPVFSPIDYYDLFGRLDVACDDLYFDIATMPANVAAMSVYRGLKPGRPYWITETGSGALDHNRPPHAGQFRAWAWSSLAHGAEAHVVFRWRTCLSGQEQELQGILEHSGAPRHRYRAVQACFRELRALWPRLAGLPLPVAPVAIVQDYQSLWIYEASRVNRDVNLLGLLYSLHRRLWHRHIEADIVPPERPLDPYRVVILPSQVHVTPEFAKRLREYVAAGGTLLAFGQIGMRDVNANYLPVPGPAGLQELLGVAIEGGMYLGSHVGPDEALWVPAGKRGHTPQRLEGSLGGVAVAGAAGAWAGDLTLRGTGRAALAFAGDTYDGQPAVVETATGRGAALYVGALGLDDGLERAALDWALNRAGVTGGPQTPEFVEVIRRGPAVFVINHRAEPVEVQLDAPGRALVGDFDGRTARLPAYGVCVVLQ